MEELKQELRKVASINKILLAAEECIKKSNIEELDIDEICKQAGLTKGAFYHHFKSKQHLLLELFNRWVTNVSLRLEFPNSINKPAGEIICEIIDRIQPSFEQNERKLPIFLKLYLDAITDSGLNEPVVKSYRSFITFFSDLITKSSKGSSSSESGKSLSRSKHGGKDSYNVNAEEISKILFALTIGLLIQGLIDPGGADWNKLAKKSVRKLLGS